MKDFPGGPVAKTQCCQCRDEGQTPDRETKIPPAVWCDLKIKNN